MYQYTPQLKALDSCTPEIRGTHPNLTVKANSPLLLAAWSAALRSHPDADFTGYLLDGIEQGFRIGYNYHSQPCQSAKQNLPSANDHPRIIADYLSSEVAKGRMLGPFPVSSIPDIQINRIGVIPKKTPGKWRLITDLSFPHGKSVNDGINPDTTTLTYMRVDDVAHQVTMLGKGASMAKVDIEEAYRLIPIHAEDKHLLGMQWEGQVYIDAVLPFGLRSAPLIFTALADGLEWILKQRGVSYIAHYLDDFITAGPPNSEQCLINQTILFETCKELGIPLAPHKSVGPTSCLIFLGIEIDSVAMELRLPHNKLHTLKELLSEWQFKKVCSREQLESLLGHLNHACSVVRPGRSFVSRLISLLTDAKKKHRNIIRINQPARSDVRWWYAFVEPWNGVSMLRQANIASPDHEIWSDASGSWGAGAFWKSEWFQLQWAPSLLDEQIAIKELIPIVIATTLWGSQWHGTTVRANCDNEAVVAVIKSGYSREPFISHLLRCIFFFSAKYDFTLTAAHIPGRLNTLADAISRNNAPYFVSSYPQANQQPTEVPQEFVNKLLVEKPDWTSNTWTLWFHSTFGQH